MPPSPDPPVSTDVATSVEAARAHHRAHGDMDGTTCLLRRCALHYPTTDPPVTPTLAERLSDEVLLKAYVAAHEKTLFARLPSNRSDKESRELREKMASAMRAVLVAAIGDMQFGADEPFTHVLPLQELPRVSALTPEPVTGEEEPHIAWPEPRRTSVKAKLGERRTAPAFHATDDDAPEPVTPPPSVPEENPLMRPTLTLPRSPEVEVAIGRLEAELAARTPPADDPRGLAVDMIDTDQLHHIANTTKDNAMRAAFLHEIADRLATQITETLSLRQSLREANEMEEHYRDECARLQQQNDRLRRERTESR